MTPLQFAVIEQLGYNPRERLTDEAKTTLSDIANHGIDGGFSGFTYYADTVQFFRDNKREIKQRAREDANEYGVTLAEFIAGFKCVSLTALMVEAALDDEPDMDDYQTVANALAWYAAETVAHELTED